ncbi:hypothetical protein ANO11243_036350 [Dothideomycetidae sp. 11243]|nr:hypothetical protein ANO11243_036350 [fungal sp. No.11243]
MAISTDHQSEMTSSAAARAGQYSVVSRPAANGPRDSVRRDQNEPEALLYDQTTRSDNYQGCWGELQFRVDRCASTQNKEWTNCDRPPDSMLLLESDELSTIADQFCVRSNKNNRVVGDRPTPDHLVGSVASLLMRMARVHTKRPVSASSSAIHSLQSTTASRKLPGDAINSRSLQWETIK